MSANQALLAPANPSKIYRINMTNQLGDVEFHRNHLRVNGRVFWDMIPAGHRDSPWSHPEIKVGYFYIAGKSDQVVRYRMEIDYVRQWKELDLASIESWIPPPRRTYLDNDIATRDYYAILIRKIDRLQREHALNELELVSSEEPVERVENYAIVIDPEWH